MKRHVSRTCEDLYNRAIDIQHGRRTGLWVPKMRALALRGHTDAMVNLADWLSGDVHKLGPHRDNFSVAGLYRRAYRSGNARGAYNLAMTYFNRNDLQGYRRWMRKAGNAGDGAAKLQARRFETRLPHFAAARIGRKRPESKRDQLA